MDLDGDACYRAILMRDVRFDGRFFTGVKTTGIYCRPVCPARTPRRENVSFLPSAAAAQEAGFRPCLRCRPEAAPNIDVWRGTSNTLSRALAMIEMGALDGGDVQALSERLCVGEGELRRLFQKHVGAAPVSVAQTQRILLAKQLIHETSLSMTQVASAAGFASTRRFNEVFRKMYGRPPAKLRRAAASPRASQARDRITILLRYRPPYDWPTMLAFLRDRAIAGVEVVMGETYARTIRIAGSQGIVSLRPGRGNALEATIRFPKLSALPMIIARLRRVFDLAADPLTIGAHLSADPVLAPLVALRPGLRVPGAWDGFELAVRAVLGQQITVSAAIGLAGKLVAAHGERLARDNEFGLTHFFPKPQRIASIDVETLSMPRARGRALASLAASVAADPQIFAARPSLEEAIAHLCALPGIGEWTAHYIAMREMREHDAFPASDIGLMRALADRHGHRPSPRELLARAERWRPWRAYAAQHLWASYVAPAAKPKRSRSSASDVAGMELS